MLQLSLNRDCRSVLTSLFQVPTIFQCSRECGQADQFGGLFGGLPISSIATTHQNFAFFVTRFDSGSASKSCAIFQAEAEVARQVTTTSDPVSIYYPGLRLAWADRWAWALARRNIC